MGFEGALGMLIGITAVVAVFTFVTIATWSENRRKERESYYRHETLNKVLEQPGDSARQVLDQFRREEIRRDVQRREGMRLGGLITLAVGVGLMVFLRVLDPVEGVYLVGLLPLLIGAVLFLYSFVIRSEPKNE